MDISKAGHTSIAIAQSNELLEYYDALEMCVYQCREQGCFHTHFGIQGDDKDYCLIKAMMQPSEHPAMFQRMCEGMQRFQELIFSHHHFETGQRILDIGCGVGGTLGRLAGLYPQCEYEGVNLNHHQLEVAKGHLASVNNVKLHYADVIKWETASRFDLIYFIESAFHIEPKADLSKKIAEISHRDARVIIVDIFMKQRLAERMSGRGGIDHALFEYLSVKQWCELLPQFDIEHYSDCTKKITASMVMRTSPEQYQEILANRFGTVDKQERERLEVQMWDLYRSYRALHRMLQRGHAEYGVLVMRRHEHD